MFLHGVSIWCNNYFFSCVGTPRVRVSDRVSAFCASCGLRVSVQLPAVCRRCSPGGGGWEEEGKEAGRKCWQRGREGGRQAGRQGGNGKRSNIGICAAAYAQVLRRVSDGLLQELRTVCQTKFAPCVGQVAEKTALHRYHCLFPQQERTKASTKAANLHPAVQPKAPTSNQKRPSIRSF